MTLNLYIVHVALNPFIFCDILVIALDTAQQFGLVTKKKSDPG